MNPPAKQPHRSRKASCIAWLGATMMRVLGRTLRFSYNDPGSFLTRDAARPVIIAMWHNRIFAVPIFYRRKVRHRRMCVLTSASKDGAILEGVMKNFGLKAVRGSSSKRGAQALAELVEEVKSGSDAVFTPDGPRGPCYHFAPGAIKLAQLTSAPLLCVRVTYQRAWRLKSWDKFYIPKPFSRVLLDILPMEEIDPSAQGEAFDAIREKCAALLGKE